jgi:uncharacterized membrane protein YcaP (DUF421 family)
MIFNGLDPIIRIVLVGTLSYAALVAMLRISGKRTLSKLSAFDLVVTVAIGSTLATTLLSRDVALIDGIVALSLLIGLQYAVSWSSLHVRIVERAVKSEPTLVARQGRILDAARRQRLTEGDLQAAARGSGLASLADADAVILEADGTLSVVRQGPEGLRFDRSSHRGPARSPR